MEVLCAHDNAASTFALINKDNLKTNPLISADLWKQSLIALVSVVLTAVAGYFISPFTGYKSVALILLLAVSVIAALFHVGPVLIAASASALIWDYFFIPPRFNFTVGSTEDGLLLLMYFAIALISGVMTWRLRSLQQREVERHEQDNAIKLYNTLFNSLSHELQTPIASIIGASDTIKDSTLSKDQQQQLMDTISDSALRLHDQVSNLLNLSRLESGFLKPKMDWCDMSELVYSSISRSEVGQESDRFRVEMPTDLPLVRLDQQLMEEALINLLKNALLYTPNDETIDIRVSCTNNYEGQLDQSGNSPENEKTSQQLIIIISDGGPGFTLADREKVFNKFYRLHHPEKKGTGLGLSIVKGFIEAHNGQIYLGESVRHGAEFTILIPVETSYLNRLKNE